MNLDCAECIFVRRFCAWCAPAVARAMAEPSRRRFLSELAKDELEYMQGMDDIDSRSRTTRYPWGPREDR